MPSSLCSRNRLECVAPKKSQTDVYTVFYILKLVIKDNWSSVAVLIWSWSYPINIQT